MQLHNCYPGNSKNGIEVSIKIKSYAPVMWLEMNPAMMKTQVNADSAFECKEDSESFSAGVLCRGFILAAHCTDWLCIMLCVKDLPLDLDISQHKLDDQAGCGNYQLMAVVTHHVIGDDDDDDGDANNDVHMRHIRSGHYAAYVRTLAGNVWHRCNDTEVTEVCRHYVVYRIIGTCDIPQPS